jgi:nicotinamidase-related amidase
MCVSSAARSGANLGWPVVVVGDACDCRDPAALDDGLIRAEDAHRVHLATLADEFATVVAAETIIARLLECEPS